MYSEKEIHELRQYFLLSILEQFWQMLAVASKSEYNIEKKEAILWQTHPLFMQE